MSRCQALPSPYLEPRIGAEPLVRRLAEPVQQHDEWKALIGRQIPRSKENETSTAFGDVEETQVSKVLGCLGFTAKCASHFRHVSAQQTDEKGTAIKVVAAVQK